jgi:hypothetical protein
MGEYTISHDTERTTTSPAPARAGRVTMFLQARVCSDPVQVRSGRYSWPPARAHDPVPEEAKMNQRSSGDAARIFPRPAIFLAIAAQAAMARGGAALAGTVRLLTMSAVEPR